MAFNPKPAEFDKWVKQELWFLADAIFLILEREPETRLDFNSATEIKFIKPDRDKILFYEIYDQAKDSIRLEKLNIFKPYAGPIFNVNVFPTDFLVWAQEKGLTIPDELCSILRKDKNIKASNTFNVESWQDSSITIHPGARMTFVNKKNGQKQTEMASTIRLANKNTGEGNEEWRILSDLATKKIVSTKKIIKVSENEIHIQQTVEKYEKLKKEKKATRKSKARTRRMQEESAMLNKERRKLKKCIEKLQRKFDGHDFLKFTYEPYQISVSLSSDYEQFKKEYIITSTLGYTPDDGYKIIFKINKICAENSSSDSTEYGQVSDVCSTLKIILREDIANYILAHKT